MNGKKIIQTLQAPRAIGPYSQAIQYGEMIFCSGQVPLDAATMEVVGKTAAEQTKKVMENIDALLSACGSQLSKIIKCTLYLQNMNDFANVNEVYGQYFPENPPARTTVEVSKLPKNVLVEIDCIAHI